MRDSAENANDDNGHDECSPDSLEEDGILDLAEGRLLNPNLAIEDLADDVALVVLGDPRLVLVAVGGGVRLEAVERIRLEVKAGGLIIGSEELPRTQMTMMHAVQDDAHSLPGGNQGGDADEEADDGEDTPGTARTAEGEEDGSNEATDDAGNTKTAGEDDTRTVAVADGPSDEVGVGLAAERPLDRGSDIAEGRRMRGVLESMEQAGAFLGREVELASTTIGDVDGYDARDLFAIRLDGHCRR